MGILICREYFYIVVPIVCWFYGLQINPSSFGPLLTDLQVTHDSSWANIVLPLGIQKKLRTQREPGIVFVARLWKKRLSPEVSRRLDVLVPLLPMSALPLCV